MYGRVKFMSESVMRGHPRDYWWYMRVFGTPTHPEAGPVVLLNPYGSTIPGPLSGTMLSYRQIRTVAELAVAYPRLLTERAICRELGIESHPEEAMPLSMRERPESDIQPTLYGPKG